MNKIKHFFTLKSIWQAMFFILAIAITLSFMPREEQVKLSYEEGKPWRHKDLTAPFAFPVYKLDNELAIERDTITKNFIPYFIKDKEKMENEVARFKADNKTDNIDTLNYILQIESKLKIVYNKGIVSSNTYETLIQNNKNKINVLEGSISSTYLTENLLTPKMAFEFIYKNVDDKTKNFIDNTKNLNSYIEPNYLYDNKTNKKAYEQLTKSIQPSINMIEKGELIISHGVKVSHDTYRILKSYEKSLLKDKDDFNKTKYIIGGELIMTIIIYSFLYLFLILFRRKIFNDIKKLSLLIILIVILTVLSYLLSQYWTLGAYIVPIAILPIITVTFLDTRIALYASIVTILLSCWASPSPIEYVIMQIIVCMTAIDSLKELTKRSQLFRSVMLILLAYCITYIGYILMSTGDYREINTTMFLLIAINCFILLFSYLLVYIIEKLWGFTSNVMLVELSDLNSPLLKSLSEKCPGTFQHATQVANLAAEAANAIGANALLIRTGALYHDIGKSVNPMFFTENQHGINPHNNLSYKESARIIISHVKEGLNLAKSYNLPKSVKGFIETHHGVSKAKYFYTMYKNENPNEDVDEKLFTYEGPKPRTKEEGILMIADILEAKSRSVKDYSEETLSHIVNSTINEIIAEGELDNTPLTFSDITEIRKVFIDRLKAIYHPRISYPKAKN